MEFKNEHLIICIIIIITVFFIINYDVYVLAKNEPLCKPVYVTKKIIDDKIIKKLKNPKESFIVSKNDSKDEDNKKIIKQENVEEENIEEENIDCENVEEENVEEENINNNKNIIRKKIIINNILNILPNIPTRLKDEEIHSIINNISKIYLNSTSMDQFYNNVNNLNKLSPNNSNYIKLILYLIDNFDSSLPINLEPKINKPLEPKINKPLENKNMFVNSNGNSPIHNRMMEQANFII